jgi:hypothetical protein
MENYSSDSIELLRDKFSEWNKAASNFSHRRAQATGRCDEFAAELCTASHSPSDCAQKRRDKCYARFRETAADQPPHPNLYEIHVRLEAIKDQGLRDRLERIQTSLELPPEDVDLLINAAATLLDQSDDHQRLLRDMGADSRKK